VPYTAGGTRRERLRADTAPHPIPPRGLPIPRAIASTADTLADRATMHILGIQLDTVIYRRGAGEEVVIRQIDAVSMEKAASGMVDGRAELVRPYPGKHPTQR
jgi:hypothetical protein